MTTRSFSFHAGRQEAVSSNQFRASEVNLLDALEAAEREPDIAVRAGSVEVLARKALPHLIAVARAILAYAATIEDREGDAVAQADAWIALDAALAPLLSEEEKP